MNILISTLSQTPIYEQIKSQIKELILSGKLKSGEQLPSIRLMAKDLKVGVVTIKRTYDELAAEGLVISIGGKGIFVDNINPKKIKQIHLDMLKDQLIDIKEFTESRSITKEEIIETLNMLYGGE